jgi:lysophospholipase L1-like esterase
LKENQIFDVVAVPQMIFDLRNHGRDSLDRVPLERFHTLQPIKDKLASGKPVRIAFYGESTTRNGRWPYQLMDGLRQLYPRSICKSSNVAVSGENSLVGVRRIQNEVLNLKPDLVLIEYLLNDTSTGKRKEVEQALRFILEQIQIIGALCLIVTGNGMNPLFSPHGSFRKFRDFYELYRQLAAEYDCAFVGGYNYFTQLQQHGVYFLTELKGNMINHPYGNVDPHWGAFDRVISDSILAGFAAASPEPEEQDAKSD